MEESKYKSNICIKDSNNIMMENLNISNISDATKLNEKINKKIEEIKGGNG